MRYTFIRAHSDSWPVRRLCWLFDVHPSGYYAWCKQPRSVRAKANNRLTGLIKQFWLESGGVYGYRKIHTDLRDIGEHCGKHRVYRLMRSAGLRAQVGYRRPRHRSGPASVHAPNRLQQQFKVARPNDTWVSDITHIRTHEGWLYLAVILDLYSQTRHRLVAAIADQQGVGTRCSADGSVAQKANKQSHRSYRSRQSIYKSRLASVPKGA